MSRPSPTESLKERLPQMSNEDLSSSEQNMKTARLGGTVISASCGIAAVKVGIVNHDPFALIEAGLAVVMGKMTYTANKMLHLVRDEQASR